MKYFASALLAFALSGAAFAQTTAVTGTVTDSNGDTWNNGTWAATLSSPRGNPTISGIPLTTAQTSLHGSLSASGALAAVLTANTSLDQAGSSWSFQLCPNASFGCSVVPGIVITGANQVISGQLSAGVRAPNFSPGLSSYGYSDTEINPATLQLGATYYNVNSTCLRQYSNAGWTCAGGGGGGGGVTSFNTRTGPVTPASNDYSFSQLSGTATTAQLPAGLAVLPVPGASAEYPLTEASGTVVNDVSGNGNTANFATGSNSPSWYSYGVAFLDTGTANGPYQSVITPLANWGALYIGYCTPAFVQTTGTGTGGTPIAQYPSFLGPVGSSSTGVLINASLSTTYTISEPPSIFGIGSSSTVTTGTQFNGGCHVYGYAPSSSADRITVDGVEVAYATRGASAALVALTGANTYALGASQNSNSLRGVMTYVVFYPVGAAHTLAQMQQETAYIQAKVAMRPTFPRIPTYSGLRSLQFVAVGDSLTAGYNGSAPPTAGVTFNNSYTTTNLGIGGINAVDIANTFAQRVSPYIVPGSSVIHVWACTNDMSVGTSAAQCGITLSQIAVAAKAAGVRAIVATMVSRTGLDSQKNSMNAVIRANWRSWGYAGLDDIASVPSLGADGANTGTGCFNTDHTHLTGGGGVTGTCATINGTAFSGYGVIGALMSNAVNVLDGATINTPTIVTAATYTTAAADNYLNANPASNSQVVTLHSCQGYGSPSQIHNVQVSGANTVTLKTASSAETVDGADYSSSGLAIANGGIVQLAPVVLNSSTGQCTWTRVQ